ncbi:TPA: hypothetical protein TY426_002378, partial [Streptococcus suis]|nr:hypothetical protein [Streptococcus suis]
GSDNQPNPAISTTDYVDETNDGTWTFTGWDKTNHVINKADGHFVGTWTFTPKTYNVTHTFVKAASVPENIELPEAIKSKIESSYNYTDVVNGDSRTPNSAINTDRYEDADNDGVWTFNRWQQDSVTVAKADAELVGEWNFTPNKYKITHEFKAADGVTIALPDAIKNRITEASNLTDLLNGSDNQPNPAISTTNYVDETNDGTWTFTGWDKDNHVINKTDGHFVGTWTFTPSTLVEKPAKVVHEFVSGTPGKELPQEVKDLLPSGFDTKFDETVRPTTPTETTVEVSDGTWTFTSYDADSKVVNEAEEKFVGTWTFTPSTPAEKPAKVVHEFVSGTPGKELPQEVKDLLPSDFDTKFDETVEPKQPTETTVKVSDGTWTFTSYDADSKVVNEAEEKFVGTWTFTPSTPVEKPAKVVHEFVSGTPDKELPQEVKDLLPSDFDTKFDETVEPKQPTENAVEVSDGTWTFTSYDADSKVVNEAEEKFVGTWTFTPSTPAEQ